MDLMVWCNPVDGYFVINYGKLVAESGCDIDEFHLTYFYNCSIFPFLSRLESKCSLL